MGADNQNEKTPLEKAVEENIRINEVLRAAATYPWASLTNYASHFANFAPYINSLNQPLSPYFSMLRGIQATDAESEVAKLRKEIAEKEEALTKQNAELISKLKTTIDEKSATEAERKELEQNLKNLSEDYSKLQKQKDLRYLLDRVCIAAAERLLQDESLVKRFENAKRCNAFVLAIDIRRSTDLMLRGKTPQNYADFLNAVSGQLLTVIKDYYGVVDKFTGDGLLAYFPDFFTGQDAGYRTLAVAQACHSVFAQLYREARNSFTVTLKDVGLGIGIDYGEVHILRVTGELTVVGAPVVYACRLSGAPATHTYMNHSAVAQLNLRCPTVFSASEVDFDIKHEGQVLCQDVTLAHIRYEPALPDWVKGSSSTKPAVESMTNSASKN